MRCKITRGSPPLAAKIKERLLTSKSRIGFKNCLKTANWAHSMPLNFCFGFGLNAHKFRKGRLFTNCLHNKQCLHYCNIFPDTGDGSMGETPYLFSIGFNDTYIHTQKYSDDGMYMIDWDIETCFPSLKLYTIYVEWIAYFQKRAGENEQTENKTIECLKWLTKLSWKYCVLVCPVCMKLALKEKCHPSPSPFTSKWFSIELSLIYFTLRHEVLS